MSYGSHIQGDQREGKGGRVAPKKGLLQGIQVAPPPCWQARPGQEGRAWDRAICFACGSAPDDFWPHPPAPSCMFEELGSGQHAGEPYCSVLTKGLEPPTNKCGVYGVA